MPKSPRQCSYAPQRISAALIRTLASWPAPEKPKEIRDPAQGLVLRHQPSGYLGLYVILGRGKRERAYSGDARALINPSNPITFKMAVLRAKVLQGKSIEGEDFSAARKASRAIPTFADFLEQTYAPWVTANRRSGTETAARLKTRFLDTFGKLKLDGITPDKVELWKARRRRKVSAETANRDITALKASLSHAVNPLRVISVNPLAGYKLEKIDRSKKVARAFTDEELEKLRHALDAREERLRTERASANEWRAKRGKPMLPILDGGFADVLKPAVLVALGTGLRRGEQFALEWPAVDFDAETIRVTGETSKSYESRDVPMNPEVKRVLRDWYMQHGRPKQGPVFPGPRGHLTSLKKSFYAVLTDAGINRNGAKGRLSWHSLRHTFATRLVARGVDVETIRELMGHAQVSTVINRYLHTEEKRKREAVALLA
jgi:integrase